MIAACVTSCLNQTRRPDQILVVNDGSTDETGEILKRFGNQIEVLTIPNATGNKSRAQEIGIRALRTDIFIATDGDTVLDRTCIEAFARTFNEYPQAAAVAGYVQSLSYNWLTAIREVEYVIGQDLYKRAQSFINFVQVIPGCAGAFRTALFREGTLFFAHDTLTEDLDLTYQLHAHGKHIAFAPDAIVYTQDPPTLSSYTRQMRRWYAGGWQNLQKHFYILTKPHASLQLTLSYVEGFVFAFLFMVLPFLDPLAYLGVLITNIVLLTMVGAYAAWRRRRIELLLLSPLRMVVQYINSYIYLEQFVSEVILRRKHMVWFSPERRPFSNPSPSRV
jgi:cellulose synthase/poly-beta-1,6-N-acetylglucosamine synthase-like glycosyltransferase